MEDDQPSVAKVVQQITETLSDAVAQLVVLVVALQEQNAEMPPTLPTAAQAVGGAATTLVNVARALASEEYADYPDMKNQILLAADGVEKAAISMLAAVTAVATSRDRKTGWNQLVECCKIIAGKTIILLQLVYGAELYRLFACSDLAFDSLNRMDSKLATSDPQTFANTAGEAATRANQLAEYVKVKAGDTESPMMKAALAEVAVMLQRDSDDLVNDANRVLQNPNNESAQKALAERLELVKAHIKKVTDPLQDDLQTVMSDIDRLQNATAGGVECLFPASKPAPGQKAPAQDLADEPVVYVAFRGGGLIEKLEASANRGDLMAVTQVMKDIDQTNKELQTSAHIAAGSLDDPAQKKRLLAALDELGQLFPVVSDLAQKTANDPKKKDELHKTNALLKTKYETIADTLRPGAATAAAIFDEQRKIEKVKNSAERGDISGLEAAIHELQDANLNLHRRVEARVVQMDDPSTKRDVIEALEELEKLLPLEMTAAKKLVKNPNNRQAQNELIDTNEKTRNALMVIESITDPTGERDILVAATQGELEANKLRDAAQSGNKDAVAEAAKRLQRSNIKLAKQARAKALKLDDPAKRQEFLDAVDELERLLPEQFSAASNAVNDPKDKSKTAQLTAVTESVLKAISVVEAAVEPAAPVVAAAKRDKLKVTQLNEAVTRGEPRDIESTLKEVQDAHDALLQRGREEEKNKIDPQRRKELGNALDELERLLPLQVKLVKEAKEKPKDSNAKKMVFEINGLVRDATDDVVRKAIPAPKDRAAEAVAQGLDELDRLLDAVKKEDTTKAASAVKALAASNLRLAEEARKQAIVTDDMAKKKAIVAAVDELERVLPVQMNLAREALANPQDKRKQNEFEEVVEQLKETSDAVLTAMADSADEATAAAANQQIKDAIRLANSAKKGNAHAVEMAAKALAKKQPKLAKQARAQAAKTDDPELKREILNTLEVLDSLIPRQIQAAKEATMDPDNEFKRKKLEEANLDILAAFEHLSESIVPNDPAQALVAAVELENRAASELRSAAQRGDLAHGEEYLSQLEDALKKVTQNAQSEAILADDPQSKKHLGEAIGDIEAIRLKIRQTALAALSNPKDKKASKALNDDLDKIVLISEKIVELARAKPMAEAHRQERELEKLSQAAKNSDPQAVAAAARALARRAPKLAEQARAQARKTDDPLKKKAILAVVDELERLLPQQVAASLAVANQPNDLSAQEKLENSMVDYTNLLNSLESAIRPIAKDKARDAAEREITNLHRLAERVAKGDIRGVEELLKQIEEDNDTLAQHARAESAKDPSCKGLRDEVFEIEDLAVLVKESTRAALKEPKDKKSQSDMNEFIKKLETRIHDITEIMDPAYRAKRERELARAAAELEEILPRLKDACERVNKNPKDRKALDELEEIITRGQFPLEVIARTRMPSLEEEVLDSRLKEKEALSSLEEQCRKGNQEAMETEIRKINRAHESFVNCSRRQAEQTRDPERKKRILDAISDLDSLLPETIKSSRKVVQNPRDATMKKELSDLMTLMNEALNRAEQEAAPSLEATVLEASAALPQETEILVKAIQEGDESRTQSVLDSMDDLVQAVVQKSKLAIDKDTDPKNKKDLIDALANLESVAAQIKPVAMATLARPKGSRTVNDLTLAARHLTSAFGTMKFALKAETIAQAQVQEANLSHLTAAAIKKDARDLAETTKTTAGLHKKLTEQAREEAARSDAARKKQIMDLVSELDTLLPRQINAVKESLQNPNNEEKRDALLRVVDSSVAVLANLQDTIRPTPSRAADKLASRDIANLALLQGFAKRGDKPNTEAALNKIRENHEELKRQARLESEKIPSLEDRERLLRAIQDLDSLFEKLSAAAREAASAPENRIKQDALDDAIYQMQKPVNTIQDAIRLSEVAKKNTFAAATATVTAVRAKKMDSRSLLQAAGDLASQLNILAYDISVQAHKGRSQATGAAAAALDLDSLLSDLDRIAGGVQNSKSVEKKEESPLNVDALIGDLEALSLSTKPSGQTTLEESIVQVAENLRKRSKSPTAGGEQMTGKHTAAIGAELSKLAVACKEGQRQQFLISARTIAGVVRALSVDVKAYATKCPDPELKERLTRSTQALQNFSIQLKILASVKAASDTPDPDAEQQLAILTQNLGHMLHNTIGAVNVCHLKYHTGML